MHYKKSRDVIEMQSGKPREAERNQKITRSGDRSTGGSSAANQDRSSATEKAHPAPVGDPGDRTVGTGGEHRGNVHLRAARPPAKPVVSFRFSLCARPSTRIDQSL